MLHRITCDENWPPSSNELMPVKVGGFKAGGVRLMGIYCSLSPSCWVLLGRAIWRFPCVTRTTEWNSKQLDCSDQKYINSPCGPSKATVRRWMPNNHVRIDRWNQCATKDSLWWKLIAIIKWTETCCKGRACPLTKGGRGNVMGFHCSPHLPQRVGSGWFGQCQGSPWPLQVNTEEATDH